MKRLLIACLILVSGSLCAADKLSAQQVKSLMVGNTINGFNEVFKVDYTVYFSPEGKIVLVTPKGKRTGSWRIAEDGHFCSLFPTEQEVCTNVVPHTEGTYQRVKDDGTPTHTLKKFTPGNVNNS
jgi:hypothetical protein